MAAALLGATAVVAIALGPATAADARRPVAAAATQQRAPGPVVVISLPGLTWSDVESLRPPVLMELADTGAVAAMSVRTLGADTSPGEAYASIGAGNRATVLDLLAGEAFSAGEELEGTTARQVAERRLGRPVDGDVVHVSVAAVAERNASLDYGAVVGLLGQALQEAGRPAGVIGNADLGAVGLPNRPFALAAMDRSGAVAAGTVGDELLVADPSAPFGVALDGPAVIAHTTEALARADAVFVEMSDLARLDAARPSYTREATERALARLVAEADRLLGEILRAAGADATVIVLSPYGPYGPDQLGVFAMRGPGIDPGWARSPTTRRAGYVTLPDIAPTVLATLGVEVPDAMSGTAVTATGARPDRWLDELVDANEAARFRDRVFTGVTASFVILQLIAYAMTAVAVVRHSRRWRTAAQWGLLTILAFPPLAYLSGLFEYRRLGEGGYPVVLALSAAAVAGLGLLASRRTPTIPLLLVTTTLVVLVGDVLTGGSLQINTVFGYSPIVAGRFAGFGNQAFALVAIAAIVSVAGWWGRAGSRRRQATALAGLALAAVVVVIGHPALGSDVGGVLASVPAFAITVMVLAERRVTIRRVVVVGLAAAVVVGGFALVDLARPAADRTHLGRFVADLGDGGEVASILSRKASTNARILTSSIWSLLVAVAIAFLGWLAWRPAKLLGAAQVRTPGLRAALLGGLVAGALGFALNDSGIAVPAMMLSIALPWVGWLVLKADVDARIEPGPAPGEALP